MRTRFLLIALICALLCTGCAFAEQVRWYECGDYRYILREDGTAEITWYSGNDEELEVPEEMDGKRVTGIGDSAFFDCTSLISVKIPDSVTEIGPAAFADCTSLTSIAIPNGVSIIDESTFSDCYSLASITLPDSVTEIGDEAFSTCESLTSLTIPSSVTQIGYGAFEYCDNLTLTVERDSYAAQYAKDNGIDYTYPDSLDWLND